MDEPEEDRRHLTLVGVVREAISVNLALAARDRTVAAGRLQVKQARSRLLPQVDLGAQGAIVDEDLGGPFQSQRSLTGTGGVSQLIYSEGAWAGLRIQRHVQRSRREERESLRLDIARDAAITYLNVLRSLTLSGCNERT